MKPDKTIEIKVERTIQAPPGEVFDGWLDPQVPGNPWNAADPDLTIGSFSTTEELR